MRTVPADAVPPGALALVRLRGTTGPRSLDAGGPGDRLIVLDPVSARKAAQLERRRMVDIVSPLTGTVARVERAVGAPSTRRPPW